jgi:predicted P-loop ATPase/GTPase
MDVIDDPVGEAKEIYGFNRWFTYGEPLHRLREFGMTVKELDLIDEGPLSMEQMMKFINFIFGVTLPQPEIDWYVTHFKLIWMIAIRIEYNKVMVICVY